MPQLSNRISPCLWFDHAAEEAANLYVSIFPNSRILEISRYTEAGPREPESVMTVEFELDGQRYIGLNGGSEFPFTEAVSFSVECEDQAEVDHYWARLSEGGKEVQCGWLKDRFGLSWQIVPRRLKELAADPDRQRAGRAFAAMLKMVKIDIAALEAAADGR